MYESESTVGLIVVLILQALFYATTVLVGTIGAAAILSARYPRPVLVAASCAIALAAWQFPFS
jgi:hypothetical protein